MGSHDGSQLQVVAIVGDITEAGPDGKILTFTTGSSGAFTLDLNLWWLDAAALRMVDMTARGQYTLANG